MIKKLILILILIIPTVLANSANYEIFEDNVIVEINLDYVNNLSLDIPFDSAAIEVNSNYSLVENGNTKNLYIEQAEKLEIKYVTKAYIESSNNKRFFIVPIGIQNLDIQIILPESAVLVDDKISVIPYSSEITTDGRRIILRWNDFHDSQILVIYEFLNVFNIEYLFLSLIILLILAIYFISKKFKENVISKRIYKRKKKTNDITKNLVREEKQIIEFLLSKRKKEAWTKELINSLNINKVKLSRKIRQLEEKGLIEKIPYGNENKIRILK
jgi:uncharacterized membrane protein